MKPAAALTDIHNHLLPAVDDGAQSFDEAMRHLETLFAEGVTQLSVSPHLFGWLTEDAGALSRRLDQLEAAFDEFAIACTGRSGVPRLFFGQEILCPSPEIARRVFAEARPGYRGTSYALVEFGFDLHGDPVNVVHTVLEAGRRIIISHPERYRRDRVPVPFDELCQWKEAGALLQVNAGSVLGDYGAGAQSLAWRLIEQKQADLVASDHHADHRIVSLQSAYERITAQAGDQMARLLLSENPARVLANQDLLPAGSL